MSSVFINLLTYPGGEKTTLHSVRWNSLNNRLAESETPARGKRKGLPTRETIRKFLGHRAKRLVRSRLMEQWNIKIFPKVMHQSKSQSCGDFIGMSMVNILREENFCLLRIHLLTRHIARHS